MCVSEKTMKTVEVAKPTVKMEDVQVKEETSFGQGFVDFLLAVTFPTFAVCRIKKFL